MDPFLSFVMSALAYAAAWHLTYWISHFVCVALVPWYQTVSQGNLVYYAKKLKVRPKSQSSEPLTPTQITAVTAYFRNYTITSLLAALHGLLLGSLLVPFVLERADFMQTAVIASSSGDPRVYKANLIFIGYLLNDFSFVFPFALKHRVADDLTFVVHHVTLIITWSLFTVEGWGDVFGVPTMLTELTAPFFFVRWVLAECHMSGSMLALINGLCIIFSWYVLRIGGYVGFLTWRLVNLREELFAPKTLSRYLPVLFFHLLGCAMQLHWGRLLTNGAIKILFSSKQEASKTAKVN